MIIPNERVVPATAPPDPGRSERPELDRADPVPGNGARDGTLRPLTNFTITRTCVAKGRGGDLDARRWFRRRRT